MAFDGNSFDTNSFDISAWLLDAVETVSRFFRQLFVRTAVDDVVAYSEANEIWVQRKIP